MIAPDDKSPDTRSGLLPASRRPLTAATVVLVLGAGYFIVGASTPATLELTSNYCRDEGQLDAYGVTWRLAGDAPREWDGRKTVEGTVRHIRFTGWATFESDGSELGLAKPDVGLNLDCSPWDPSRSRG